MITGAVLTPVLAQVAVAGETIDADSLERLSINIRLPQRGGATNQPKLQEEVAADPRKVGDDIITATL